MTRHRQKTGQQGTADAPRRKAAKAIAITAFYAACILLGVFIGRHVGDTPGGFAALMLHLIIGIGLLMAAIIVQIIIHECGHLVAGLVAGWRLVALRIFGLMLVRRGRKFVLASSHIPGTGGQCLMSPPDRPAAQCRLTLYNAGGFAANLITAAASLAVLLLAGRQMGFAGQTFTLSMAVSGAFLFIQNGVPLVLAGIPNDAMNIRYLRRDPAEADALLAMMRANAMMQDGIRLKDMPDSLFAGAQADGRQRGPISSSLDIMLLCRAIDMHDFTLAGRLADDISSRNDGTLPAIYDGEVGRERLFLALIARRPHDEIERLYDKKLRSYVKTMSSWQLSSVRLLYALALLHDGDTEAAHRLRTRFDKMAAGYFSPADAESERELMACIDAVAATPSAE